MSQTDRVDTGFAEGELEALLAAVGALEGMLPGLVNLDAGDRKRLAKMGPRSQAFVTQSLAAGENNPQFVPPYVGLAGMRRDLEYALALGVVEGQLRSLLEKVSDTRILAGSEAYSTALQLYRSLEGAEKSSVPGAGALREDLSSRFRGQRGTRRKAGEAAGVSE